jgi:hypothetical protein
MEWHTMASLAPSAKNEGRLPGGCRTTAQMNHKGVEFTVTPVAWAAPIGRMAFTNYLMQSEIFGWLFYG